MGKNNDITIRRPAACGCLGLIAIAGALVIGAPAGCNLVGNNWEYSHGTRIGVINKYSNKGMVWKTYEGEMALEGIVSTGNSVGANLWDFSLDSEARHGENIQDLNSKLETYAREGTKVRITYKQMMSTWPWRSESSYLVQDVEPVKQ